LDPTVLGQHKYDSREMDYAFLSTFTNGVRTFAISGAQHRYRYNIDTTMRYQ